MQPETEAELAQIIRDARAPLSIAGGATRLWPGEAAGGGALRTGGLRGVRLYEPEALTLVVGAGTPLAEVQQLLEAEGQILGFEPTPGGPGSTIGGVVAANASGPRRLQVGAARDALLGVRLVDGTGETIQNGGRVMKNVTGYDLVKLMAGSRGRLGVLTEVSLRTTPRPPCRATLHLPGCAASDAVALLTAALGGPFDISGAGWLPGPGAILRIEGLAGSVRLRTAALRQKLAAFGALEELDGDPWPQLNPPAAGAEGTEIWRILCRPGEAPALLAALPEPLSLDWGGALIHVALPAGAVPALPGFSGHARRISGAVPMILPPPDPVATRLEDGLRRRFDPRGILAGGAG